ncbi:hypothetical protein TBLA_0A10060 [Henningerozyma blattae CBS 6284]|uniref:Uncharacterized protein n=1 Tax=Henningerozyma blattae (strain ATCC 34711 / CBS 6284 / DSM 70876 / NBRC 10599 / NRRL Y-10934 / UCD 77-7) TaxID=1071380 RepID=I2GXD4_HENB6|nr:hypothetical protein TBLA_0A10060 [Tetrapisispora blattae CBS 6284]CCH58786.1 hypothetical protein TBLA_0A10060 [Tetrapisispora blattae CBS 6284]
MHLPNILFNDSTTLVQIGIMINTHPQPSPTQTILIYTHTQQTLQDTIADLRSCTEQVTWLTAPDHSLHSNNPGTLAPTLAHALQARENARRLYRYTLAHPLVDELALERDMARDLEQELFQNLLVDLKSELAILDHLLGLYPRRGGFP